MEYAPAGDTLNRIAEAIKGADSAVISGYMLYLRAKSPVGKTRAAPVSGQPSMHARVVLVLLCMSSARTGAALSRRCFCRICRNHGGGGGSAVGSSHHARA